MLFVLVPEDLAKLLEVFCLAYALRKALFVRLWDWRADDEVEEIARAFIEPFNDRFGEEGDNEGEDGLEKDENATDDEGDIVSGRDATDEGEPGHGGRERRSGEQRLAALMLKENRDGNRRVIASGR